MASEREILNEFIAKSLYSVFDAEKRFLETCTNGELTSKEIHLLEAVFNAQKIGNNNFSFVANKLGITLGTLTTAVSKLERKKYLKKERFIIDQRVYYIVPLPKAAKVHELHMKWHEKIIDDTLKCIPEKDLPVFVNALNNLSWAINKHV